MNRHIAFANQLSSQWTSVRWNRDSLIRIAQSVLRHENSTIDDLVGKVLKRYPHGVRPFRKPLMTWLFPLKEFRLATRKVKFHKTSKISAQMSPSNFVARPDQLPSFTTNAQLSTWLGISPAELQWFVDRRDWNATVESTRLQHYRYRWVRKRRDHYRLIEAPKPRLKAMQRRILDDILGCNDAHACAHGFEQQRSIKTMALPHCQQAFVMRLDLQDFFPSIRTFQIVRLFMQLGYPEPISKRLCDLCTTASPRVILESLEGDQNLSRDTMSRLYASYDRRHLPQGSPSSPAIANQIAWRLDVRLKGLADSMNLNYSRYADDLVFSGGRAFQRCAKSFHAFVLSIILEEGYQIHPRKTRFMPSAQRQTVTGTVVNRHVNIRRSEFDNLKATLHNCMRFGPSGQNRLLHPNFKEHLAGKISFVTQLNQAKGAKLQQIFEQIDWNR